MDPGLLWVPMSPGVLTNDHLGSWERDGMLKHGTNRGWEAGCRERCCMRARNTYHRGQQRLRNSQSQHFVPAVEALRAVREVAQAQGLRDYDVARAAGFHINTLSRWRQNKTQRVSVATLKKIRSVRTEPEHIRDATGTVRRLQAMQLRGFSSTALDEISKGQISHRTIRLLVTGKQPTVTVRVYDVVRHLMHSTTFMEEPTGRYADTVRRTAQRNGYLPFGVWDNIDDPSCIPDKAVTSELEGVSMPPETLEAVTRCRSLASRGFQITELAVQADVPKSTLYKIIYGERPGTKREVVDKILAACDEFEPRPDPEGPLANKTRTIAAQRGWTATMDSSD